MNIDKKKEEKKLRDLTPEKDAKGGLHAAVESDRPWRKPPVNPGCYEAEIQNVKDQQRQ